MERDAVMDHREAEERQLVDLYLMGRLPPGEMERFEQHYLHCQQCLDQLELAEKLQRGLKRAVAQDAAAARAAQQVGILAWLVRAARSRRLAMLAALLVVLLPSALLIRQLQRPSTFPPQINTAVFSLSPERGDPQAGEEPSHRIRLSDSPEWIVLALAIDLPEHQSYRVVLSREGEEIWRRDGLVPDARDELVLSLHSSWLEAAGAATSADYVARIEGLTPSGEAKVVAHFPFRVISAE